MPQKNGIDPVERVQLGCVIREAAFNLGKLLGCAVVWDNNRIFVYGRRSNVQAYETFYTAQRNEPNLANEIAFWDVYDPDSDIPYHLRNDVAGRDEREAADKVKHRIAGDYPQLIQPIGDGLFTLHPVAGGLHVGGMQLP